MITQARLLGAIHNCEEAWKWFIWVLKFHPKIFIDFTAAHIDPLIAAWISASPQNAKGTAQLLLLSTQHG